MPRSKTHYPEINDIREDLDSLKSNVVELTKHVRQDGKEQTKELKSTALKQLGLLQESGKKQYENVEKRIKEKPAQSVAVAFAAGLAASLLFGRR